MQVGEQFCGSKSEGLEESLRKQSLAYFRNYHRARLDELRMFLENEAWELCPVKSNFSVMMLQVRLVLLLSLTKWRFNIMISIYGCFITYLYKEHIRKNLECDNS